MHHILQTSNEVPVVGSQKLITVTELDIYIF